MNRERNAAYFDVLGIGFGPSNIALAVAVEEIAPQLNIHFLEAAAKPGWHPHMLLDGSDIQNNPIRDLVSLRNPRSKYSFINYLWTEGRLLNFLNLGVTYPLRKDYAKYIEWVAKHFSKSVSYGQSVEEISYDQDRRLWKVVSGRGVFFAKYLVFGTGRALNIPEVFQQSLGDRVFHFTEYLKHMRDKGRYFNDVVVLGASQSAVEINNDILTAYPHINVHAIHRSFAMVQKDTSPFSDHVYFPEFVEYFFSKDSTARAELNRQLRRTNYQSADIDVLHRLYMTIYEDKIDGRRRFTIHNNSVVKKCEVTHDKVNITIYDQFSGSERRLSVDAVVLATGFLDLGVGGGPDEFPPLLAKIVPELNSTADGRLEVARDYSVASRHGLKIYLNGLCESSHGLGDAGSFSLLSLRSAEIVTSIADCLSDNNVDNISGQFDISKMNGRSYEKQL